MSTSDHPPGNDPRGPTDAGTPVGPGMPATKSPAPLTEQAFSVPTLAVYLQEVTEGAPARRRCRMIAGAAAMTAVLPLSVPLGGYGPRVSR